MKKNTEIINDNSTRLNIDFISKRKVYYTISICLILAGILVSVIFGVKLDIQFKGGIIIKYSYTGTIDKAKAQEIGKGVLKSDVSVQLNKDVVSNTQRLVLESDTTSISEATQQKLYEAYNTAFSGNHIQKYESNDVSPEMGAQFFRQSILAVLLASTLIIIYIWIRFRHIGGLPAGITAFIALVHDVVMAFVAFSVFRIPLNDNFIAIALTILGYSINDTIVVYDRIRENRKLYGSKVHFKDIVNRSINQSFARSINTTLVTFFAIATICVFSVIFNIESIRNFALPMMVGVVTGCYSTICIAGPLWVTWVSYKEKKEENSSKGNKKLKPKNA
ncbi:MAG TPA: protein translocase subunit SecF [Clostridia bacterium]|nr:protein translocase subunit SecF [Clostridia bacterium]